MNDKCLKYRQQKEESHIGIGEMGFTGTGAD
jgi:hypothetical protein